MARKEYEEYWLYIVENAATEPRLCTIQNPAAKLHVEEVHEVVRYVITNWQKAYNE